MKTPVQRIIAHLKKYGWPITMDEETSWLNAEKEQMCAFADEFAIECINFHHEKIMSPEKFFELTYGGNK